MAITPGDDIETKTGEPLPRGSWFDRAGKMTREVINYFNGKDRLAGEIVSGINRNRQNIVQLETEYQAADGALSTAYIAADAVVAADAASANASLQTTLRAEYQAADSAIEGDVATNAAAITTEQTVRANADSALASDISDLTTTVGGNTANISANATAISTEASARATADDTVLATTRSESQRPNLIPLEYRLFGENDPPDLTFQFVNQTATGIDNEFLLRDALRVSTTGGQAYGRIRLTPANGTTNISLAPGRYAYKVRLRFDGAEVDEFQFRLRDSSNSIEVTGSHSISGGWETFEGVLDLSAATETEFYVELNMNLTSAASGNSMWFGACQLERISADADGPGDWNLTDGGSASVKTLKEAFVDSDGNAIARIREEVAASGSDPALMTLESADGTSKYGLVASIIRLFNNVGSSTIEVMRAVGGYVFFSNPISIDRDGYRTTLGPNDDLVLWFGDDGEDPPDQTVANSIFALATDGKVYFGGGDIATEIGNLKAIANGGSWLGTAGSGRQTGDMVCTVTNGSGSQTYRWSSDDPAVSFTAPTSATTKAQRDISVGVSVEAVCRCLVTDGTESVEAVALATWDPI